MLQASSPQVEQYPSPVDAADFFDAQPVTRAVAAVPAGFASIIGGASSCAAEAAVLTTPACSSLSVLWPRRAAAGAALPTVLLPTYVVLACPRGVDSSQHWAQGAVHDALVTLEGVVCAAHPHRAKLWVFAHMGTHGVVASVRLYGTADNECVAEFRRDSGSRIAFTRLYARAQAALAACKVETTACGFHASPDAFEAPPVPAGVRVPAEGYAAAAATLNALLTHCLAAQCASSQREVAGVVAAVCAVGKNKRPLTPSLALALEQCGLLSSLIHTAGDAAADAIVRLSCCAAARQIVIALLSQPDAWHTAQRLPPASTRTLPSDAACCCYGAKSPTLLHGISKCVTLRLQELETLLALVPAPVPCTH